MLSGIQKICPSKEELSLPSKTNVLCPIEGCGRIIFSSSALKMHIIKVHKVYQDEDDRHVFNNRAKIKTNKVFQYHCPFTNCVFNINSERYFSSMKLLKQHFIKVHAEKKYNCSKCNRGFGMISDCLRHEQNCGIVYSCSCNCPFSTKEALLTHAKRQQHMLPSHILLNSKKRKSCEKINTKSEKIAAMDQAYQPFIIKVIPSSAVNLNQDPKPNLSNIASSNKPRWILPKLPLSVCNSKSGQHNSSNLVLPLDISSNKNSTWTQTEQLSCGPLNPLDSRKKLFNSASLNILKGHDKLKEKYYLPLKSRSGNLRKKSIAQTQTSGDYILKKAMASANLIVNKESRGAQCSSTLKNKSATTESAETQTAQSHVKMTRTRLAAKCSTVGHIPFAIPWSTPFLDDFGCSDNETQTVDLWPELEQLLNQQAVSVLPNVSHAFRDVVLDSVSIPRSTSSTQTSLVNNRMRSLNDIQTDTSDFDLLALVNSSHFPQQHQVSSVTANRNNHISGDPVLPIDSQSNFTMVNLSSFMDKDNSANDSSHSSSLDDLLDTNSPISASTFYSHIETQTNEDLLAYDQILMNMETQTTDDNLFPDLEFVDIETQTSFVNLNTVETQTSVRALISQGLLSSSIHTQTQTLLDELDLGGTELTDSHTQTTWSCLQDLVAQLEDNYIISNKI